MTEQRVRIEITGRVQGVGFRPAVHRYATERNLPGWVSNGPEGVTIEVQGEPRTLVGFVERLRTGLPPHASVKHLNVTPLDPADLPRPFRIMPSRANGNSNSAMVPPDLALCEDCRKDVLDPAGRRHLYPFTNCTNCGPRFSIVFSLPYDRPDTTMHAFGMCADCRAEYADPADRRFHAQPNACSVCGPRVSWWTGKAAVTGEAIREAARFLAAGKIVAIQSIGGFHLACDAAQKDAVEMLRHRKNRPHKPLAVMVADLAEAQKVSAVPAPAQRLLASPEAPILTLPSRSPALKWIAPGLDHIGILLAYTPLHLVLFQELEAIRGPKILVMTSGNPPGEPICREPLQARERLGNIADGFLVHDRPIHNRCDDSVAVWDGSGSRVVRRARGFVPTPVTLPSHVPCVFAAGADLKNAACVTRGNEAFLAQYVGDLSSMANEEFFLEAADRLMRFLDVAPEMVAHDLHPDMVSTRKARELAAAYGVPPEAVVAVQHHHAHIAATMAEHGLSGRVIGVAFDGFGLGDVPGALDGGRGAAWGGEFFAVEDDRFRRVGHLWPVALPGGDQAAVEIWRMAVSWMAESMGPDKTVAAARRLFPNVNSSAISHVLRLCERPSLTGKTTSVGRLFDAIAAIAGLRTDVTYEGQAAMMLESSCDDMAAAAGYEFRSEKYSGGTVLDARPAVRAVVEDHLHGVPVGTISARFHKGLASAAANFCTALAKSFGAGRIVAGGGVFQNMRFLKYLETDIRRNSLEFYAPRRIPANDGGIALGQAWICAKRLEKSIKRGR